MSVKVTWDNTDKTILCQTFSGRWEVEDLHRCADKTYKLLSGLDHPVHIIMDLSESRTPTNVLSAMRYLDSKVADNQGVVVMVGIDEFLMSVLEASKKLAPKVTQNGYLADSLDEARHIIQENVFVTAGGD